MWQILVTLCVVKSALAQSEDSIIVQIDQGPVRGYKDVQGGVYTFLNIPYATAPTGFDKFKAPLPPPTWTEPYDVRDKLITCIQPISVPNLLMQEDCLVANLYVPENTGTGVPVVVNIHGGAYQVGGTYMMQFTSIARTQKVIAVTFNYRLGAPGFLCLGTDNIPGNAGMKDQVHLLRWIKSNIARFGGDPDDVTIYGCSAGGGSVDFLTLSPMAYGLFKKAITESGAVLGSVGTQVDPLENAKMYAKILNFHNVDDLNALEEFYTSASYELLISEINFIINKYPTTFYFTPCIERETVAEKFLNDTPVNIINNGAYNKVPTLYGFAEKEGLLYIHLFDSYKIEMNEKFSDFLPVELEFEDEIQKESVAMRVKEFYFGNQNVSEETILAYVDYFTDVLFAYPMLRAANLRRVSMNDTIFLFKYSFVDENTPFVPHTNVRGADHCDQLRVIMDETQSNRSEEFTIMRDYMREMWINFITTGNPTPEGSTLPAWLSVNGVNLPFMALNETRVLVNSPLLEERVKFWDAIYEEHYKMPIPPIVDDPEPNNASILYISYIFILKVFILKIFF